MVAWLAVARCAAVGSSEVRAALDHELRARSLLQGKEKKGKNPRGSIVVTDCGSVGLCAVGVAVMVYPAGVWYAQVRAEDIPEIVERHLLKGEIVERLALIETLPCATTLQALSREKLAENPDQ